MKRLLRLSPSPRFSIPASVLLVALLFAPVLLADPEPGQSNVVAAEALFVEGRRLMEIGEYEQACKKFSESQRLDSGIGTLMNLARCYKASGRSASAWATYRHAAALAATEGQLARERVARREAAELERTLATLAIQVTGTLPVGSDVTLDGTSLGRELLGVATPVDPGEHEVRVSAKGRVPWSASIRIEPEERRTVVIPAHALTATEPPAPRRNAWSALHTVAVVEAGVALVASGIGAYLLASAQSDYDSGANDCTTETRCGPEGTRLRERAADKAELATVSFVVAGTALAGAGVLWLSAPPLGAEPARSGWFTGFSSVW